jgi:hypothetical protein
VRSSEAIPRDAERLRSRPCRMQVQIFETSLRPHAPQESSALAEMLSHSIAAHSHYIGALAIGRVRSRRLRRMRRSNRTTPVVAEAKPPTRSGSTIAYHKARWSLRNG